MNNLIQFKESLKLMIVCNNFGLKFWSKKGWDSNRREDKWDF